MKCFYHNDMDGHAAGALIRMALDLTGSDESEYRNDFIECNYGHIDTDIVDPGEEVYFVDYSFTESTKHVLDDLIYKDCHIIWIDHHDSSIELCKRHSYYDNLPGDRSKDGSGAWLVHRYLYPDKEIPWWIKYVSDYDTWEHRYGQVSDYFKLGIDSLDNDVFDPIWDLLELDEFRYKDVIESGTIIKSYIDRENKNYLESYGYESSTEYGDPVYVVNKKTNSWIFGDLIDRYTAVVVYVFDGDKFSYSMYSSDPRFDCSKYAERYGGGGHAGAAGFTSTEFLFPKED